jgi:hypothetical protein
MKNRFFIAFFFILTLPVLLCAESSAEPDKSKMVEIGIYITSIHNIDFKEREYDMTFWLWVRYSNRKFDLKNNLEIPNAKTFKPAYVDVDSSKGDIYILMKVESVMKDSWQIEHFPFDRQVLRLTIENSNSDFEAHNLIFVVDSIGSGIHEPGKGKWPTIPGWDIDSTRTRYFVESSEYKTTFGAIPMENRKAVVNGKDSSSFYSAFKCRIAINRREPGLLFSKMFLGMYVAFLTAYLCFYIRPGNYDSRFQLNVGALFAAIGNKYIVESSLPESTSFTLVDTLHALTLLFILLGIASTALSLYIRTRMSNYNYLRFDMIAAEAFLFLYTIWNIYFIWQAKSNTDLGIGISLIFVGISIGALIAAIVFFQRGRAVDFPPKSKN